MKKILALVMVGVLSMGLFGCNSNEIPKKADPANSLEEVKEVGEKGEIATDINLESINKFLNESADLGPGSIANPVAIIPYKHIDGPKNNSDFYAFVNFQYQARDFIKYQISYVSCTCRPAAVNYWQTAYVELSLPSSKNVEDVVLRKISFDTDPSEHYLGGFWGDSNPTPAGVTYDTFKSEYISFFDKKEYTYLKTLDTMWDIKLEDYKSGEGRENFEIDTFTGSSVSANNIIRIVNALMEHHIQNEFFNK